MTGISAKGAVNGDLQERVAWDFGLVWVKKVKSRRLRVIDS